MNYTENEVKNTLLCCYGPDYDFGVKIDEQEQVYKISMVDEDTHDMFRFNLNEDGKILSYSGSEDLQREIERHHKYFLSKFIKD